jgi:hypothetical protein
MHGLFLGISDCTCSSVWLGSSPCLGAKNTAIDLVGGPRVTENRVSDLELPPKADVVDWWSIAVKFSSPEDRRKFLGALDETESRLLVFYQYLLYFLIVTVTVLAFFFYRAVESEAFRDFLRVYGSILYLIFLAWAVGQLFVIRKRQSRATSGWNAPSPGDPKIAMDLSKDPDTSARRFSFQFHSGPQATGRSPKAVSFGFSASSIANEDKLDDAALAQAQAYLEGGSSLDMICRLLNHRYKDWSSPQQQLYRGYLQGEIELRKLGASQMNDTSAPWVAASTQDVSAAQLSSAPETERPSARQPLSPFAQIMVFFVFLAILTGTFLTALYFYYRVK